MSNLEGKRGVKRKREGKEEDVSQRVRSKLHHAVKEVKKTSKRVKVFESQKIVKKLKDARKAGNEENVKAQELLLDCIKRIDCEHIGVQALRTKIKKDHGLWNNDDCQAAVTVELPISQDDDIDPHPQHALVKARLLSSKVLAQAISDVIRSLRGVLGIEGKENIQLASEGSEAHVDSATGNAMKMGPKGKKVEGRTTIGDVSESEGDGVNAIGDEWAGFGDERGLADDDDGDEDNEEEELDDEGKAAEAVGWESGTVDDTDDDDDDERSVEEENYDSDGSIASPSSDDPGPSKKARPVATQSSNARAGESTFLPSLAVGFVKGSDSEWSDAEADLADLPQKKNRRGQRARKAIWEKKFGKNANHLKKQRESEVQDTIAHSYAKRGRGSARGRASGGRGRGGLPSQDSSYSAGRTGDSGRGRGGRHEQADPRHAQANHRDSQLARTGDGPAERSRPFDRPTQRPHEEKPLHPSWEAKRRLKEKQSPAILPAQGTRIKFD